MARRRFLAQLAFWPFAAVLPGAFTGPPTNRLKILMKSAWGSDDPTKAAFPFSHGHALAEAGHESGSSCWERPSGSCVDRWPRRSCPSAGRRSRRCSGEWQNAGFPLMPAVRAHGREGSRRRIWRIGAPSSEARRSSCRSWSGPTESSRSRSALRPAAEVPRLGQHLKGTVE